MKKLLLLIVVLVGCSSPKIKSTKKYVVVSTFNEIIKETNNKAEAYETAHNLTLMGRVFSSKPCYFVLEKDSSLDKDL